uniref:Uncharacterized protein n=1 Tax=Percolomonas cosmopolitus TaxID=63605 RepID=A0A7S1KPP1_9EUKA|mmetsp:Transcript_4167/g.15719  ORF Transcript_4167/g.15719 Transcript_4167/m.15719 type:complete len:115 (+) Transcript_4167:54-398(+)
MQRTRQQTSFLSPAGAPGNPSDNNGIVQKMKNAANGVVDWVEDKGAEFQVACSGEKAERKIHEKLMEKRHSERQKYYGNAGRGSDTLSSKGKIAATGGSGIAEQWEDVELLGSQ